MKSFITILRGGGGYTNIHVNQQFHGSSSKIAIFYIGIQVLNKLPGKARVQNLPKFKFNLKSILVDHPTYNLTDIQNSLPIN